MFYDIFCALCERDHVTRTKACTDCEMSRTAWRKWTDGGVPNGNAMARFAEYFHVSLDFLLGLTPDSYQMLTKYKLREATAQYEAETDEEKKQELAAQIDLLRESLEDQKFASGITEKKKEPPAAISDEQLKFALWGDTDVITDADLEDVRRFAAFIRQKREQEDGKK